MAEWWLAGRYRLIEELGSGGMAVVWRAQDTHMHRAVAVKLLRDVYGVPGAADRFAREARTAGTLSSPHIVTVHDFGTGLLQPALPDDPHTPPAPDGTAREAVYVTMELVPGRSLAKVVADEAPLPLGRVLDWARQLCDALEVAHDAGVLHRDIKPANIMATDKGVLKVLDFGIARFMKTVTAGSTVTRPGAVLGTAAYMSPEQASGAILDPRSDLYSAGCLLYELLTGLPPFGFGDVPSLLFRHVHVAPESPEQTRPDLPPEMYDLILALLAKDPADRPQDAAELRRRLAALPDPPPPSVPSFPERAEELARRMEEIGELAPSDAVTRLRELLREHIEVFGHDHPRTLSVRDDLAYYLGMNGDAQTAVRVLRQLVSDYGRVCGAEHPDTLGVRRSLAYWTNKSQQHADAARLLRDLLPDYTQVHGPGDPETFKVRRELALYTGRSGDADEAVRLLRDLIPEMTEALGSDHRRVAVARDDLTYWENRMTPTQPTC
ncbi:serine/threonine-protein kinase [Yinghuangia seranimata]|nr:serine/threonine-protein kinase [Yinghuangia seranimata]